MCHKIQFIYACGHRAENEIDIPFVLEDCPKVQRRTKVHFLPLDRCWDADPEIRMVRGYCPGNNDCREIAFWRDGWQCCGCRHYSFGGILNCVGCKHYACEDCKIWPRAGQQQLKTGRSNY